MQLKKKRTAWWLAGAIFAWQFVGQPLWNLNVERVAESAEIDTTLARFSPMTWLAEIAAYLPNSFATGFAVGALIFAYWDTILAWSRRRFRKQGELPDMRVWVGTIVPYIERKERQLTLWFHMVGIGDVPVKIADISGRVVWRGNNGSDKEMKVELGAPQVIQNIEGNFERGLHGALVISMVLPPTVWDLLPDMLMWTRPRSYLELNNLDIWLESERGTRKRLPIWSSIRLTAGDWEMRYVQTFPINENGEVDNLKAALAKVNKTFGVGL